MGKVIVIGGGIAGLSSAWRLQQSGHDVEVLEREPVAGGRMRSERHGEFIVDRGAQFIASGYTNLHALAAEVGLADQVRPVARVNNAILRHGQLNPADYDSPLGFLRSPLLSFTAKLRLPALLFALWKHRRILDPRRPELAAAIDRDDMSVFLRAAVGEEALEYVFAPAFSSTFDSAPEDLSGAFVLLVLRFLLGGFDLQSFEAGTGRLTATLAAKLNVRTGCEVRRVDGNNEHARVVYHCDGREQEVTADAAVIAVPGSLVSSICPRLRAAEQAFFAAVRYGRGIVVFLMTAQIPATLPYYGVAFPRREGIDLYGLAVDHHKAAVAPNGAGLLNAALTTAAATRLWNETDDVIVEHVVANLARTPIGRLQPIDAVVHRWDPMLPQFYAGYLHHLASFLSRRERSPRLAFAGDYLVGPYTEAALTSGLRAASELEFLSSSPSTATLPMSRFSPSPG